MADVSLFKTLRRSVLLWVGALFFTAGTVGTFIAFQEWQTRQHFERESVQTQATILSKSIEKASAGWESPHEVPGDLPLRGSRRRHRGAEW